MKESEIKIMDNKKIVAILRSEEVYEEINDIQIIDDKDIVIEGETWRVLDDEEADEAFEYYQKDLLRDLGLTSFSSWAKDYIMENCVDVDWFEDCMRQSYETYVEELKQEKRLEDEMNEVGVEDEEEFIEHLCGQWHDGIEWYMEQYGTEECEMAIENNNLYDTDKVIEYVKEHDGRGCLALYDGQEIELQDGYFAYRID